MHIKGTRQALGVNLTQENEMLTRDVSVPKPVSKVCSVLVAVLNWLSRLLLTYSTSNESVGCSSDPDDQPLQIKTTANHDCIS